MSSLLRVAPLVTLALLSATGATAQQFEGAFITTRYHLSSEQATDQGEAARDRMFALTLDQLIRLGAEVDSQRMQVKGPRFRSASTEMPGMGVGYTLMDATSGMIQMVIPAKRGYYEVSLRGRGSSEETEEEEQPQVEPLGRTQAINGLRCTGYRVTDEDEVSLVWTTSDPAFRDLFQTQMRMLGEDSEIAEAGALWARYGYPVMTQEMGEDGTYRVEVWSLDRQRLADSLFVVPPRFRKLTVPGM